MGHGKRTFSTQEMANALAVSTPTAITLLRRRLEGHGLVQPLREFSSTGGRKPRAWSACPGARYVVGADITLRHVSLVAVDLSGQVTRTQTRTLAFYAYARLFSGARRVHQRAVRGAAPAIGFGRRPVHSRYHRQRAGPRPALPRAFHSGTAGR